MTLTKSLRVFTCSLLLGSLCFAAPAGAAATGDVVGRVTNESTGRPQKGVRVTLTQITEDGTQKRRSVTTNDRGRYNFERLETGREFVYALDAEFQDGLFAGSAITLPSDTEERPVVETKLRVWPTTTDPEVIQLPRNDIFATQRGNTLGLIESVTIYNTSQKAYIGRGRGMGSTEATPSIAFALPDTAIVDENGAPQIQLLDSEIDLPTLLPSEFGFAATAAIPPGQHKVTFTYAILGDGGTFELSRTALYPTVNFEVYAAEPLDIRSNRLASRGEVTVGERSYVRYASQGPVEAGDPIQVVAVAQAGSSVTRSLGLVVGAAAALIALAYLLLRILRRRKQKSPASPPAVAPGPADRQELLVAIARLDLQREAGTIDEPRWREERERLKQELETATGAPS